MYLVARARTKVEHDATGGLNKRGDDSSVFEGDESASFRVVSFLIWRKGIDWTYKLLGTILRKRCLEFVGGA
jgi:hypothetical protein